MRENKGCEGRLEDRRLLTGGGRFTEDVIPPGTARAAFLRSPVAHGGIAHLDVTIAREMPGVLAVYGGVDLERLGLHPMICASARKSTDGAPFFAPERPVLARETVRFVGDPIACVIARTEAEAIDAVEAIDFDVEEHPAVIDPTQSVEIGFIHEEGDKTAVDAAFMAATRVVSIDLHNNRLIICPMENRTYLAAFDPGTDRYTLTTQSQGAHWLRGLLAPTLGIDPERLRVITPDVGGSFGIRITNYPEQTVLLAAARELGEPVAWVSSRSEAFLSDAQGRDQTSHAELALDRDNRITALRVETIGNFGAYASSGAAGVLGNGVSKSLGHCYRIPVQHFTAKAVYTNTAPTDAYRGAGKPEAQTLVELLVDKAAKACGMDPVEFRRRNLIPENAMPYKAAHGFTYDFARFEAVMDKALSEADWGGFHERRVASEAAGKLRGIGLGLYLHITGGRLTETSWVALMPDGMIEVRTGVQASGQGHETAFAELVAQRLGVSRDTIRVREGDSDILPRGGGTGGSNSLPIGAATIARATDIFLENARELAADTLEAAAADLEFATGEFTIVGTDRRIALRDLKPLASSDLDAPACVGSAEFEGDHQTIPHGAYIAEVEIDPETGTLSLERFSGVDDLGVRLNPAIADGQLQGGITQGIAQVLQEHTVHDGDTGQLLSGSFMDYVLPRAGDYPTFALTAADLPARENALGMKGAGENGCIGAPGAILNAIADAVGTHDLHMPVTAERLWRLLGSGMNSPNP